MADEQRARYHAGLVHGANHLTTLLTQAIDVLREAGVADPAATLRPLLAATLDNTLRSGHHALTGPIARGDVDTVAAHLAVLRDRTASTYAELARATVELAAADGRLDPDTVVHRFARGAGAGSDRGGTAMRLTQTKAELRAAAAIRPRAVVMTMGALHEGHAALLAEARERVGPDGSVVLTIFVNPLQFGPTEDFDRYPRTLASDLAIAKNEGVDLVFNPSRDELYPNEPSITVHPGPLADELEGMVRPGHFAGVLTVVAKMLHLTAPDLALFGEKDYQQLTLIREMVCDLDWDVDIVPVPTVREADGLALSSRNRYLDETERDEALVLYRALTAGAKAGMNGPDAVLAAAHAELEAVPSVRDRLSRPARTGPRPGDRPRRGPHADRRPRRDHSSH